MREERCENCRFFDGGVCKRYPPSLVETVSEYDYEYEGNPRYKDVIYHIFPSVPENEWCGEFKDGREGGDIDAET